MGGLISRLLNNGKVVLLCIVAVLLSGLMAYGTMPRENSPDITVPVVFVSVTKLGYSPQDSVDLLALPMEREFSLLEGLESMETFAAENYAGVLLRFEASADMEKALQEVNRAADSAQSKLPQGTERPKVSEFKVDNAPISRIVVSGASSSRYLSHTSDKVKRNLELLPGVLEVETYGKRD